MITVQELIDNLMKIKDKSKTISIGSMSDHLDEYDFELSTDYNDSDSIQVIMNNYAQSE